MSISSDTLVRKHFDYDRLDVADAVFIRHQTNQIRTLRQRAAQDMLQIGEILIQSKARLRHGQFGTWLEAEVNMSQDTAERLMNVRRFCEENPQFAEFADQFAKAAFYVITAPSTSKAAREEALALAKAGKFISPKIARDTKHKYSRTPKQEANTTTQPPQPTPASTVTSEPLSISQPVAVPPTPAPAQSRRRAIELSQSKPEIMAVRPQRWATSPFEEGEELEPAGVPAEKPLARFVQPGTWWQLEEKHLLYCGEPTSQRFRERLLEKVALSLAFPPSREEWPQAPSDTVASAMVLFTRYEQDQDLELFRQMIKSLVHASLLLYTGDRDAIVFSFLPDPGLVVLAHELGCRCFCAEPDLVRCEVAIRAWRESGFRAEKVTGLRF